MIGDSYIEGLVLKEQERIQSILAKSSPTIDLIPIALSGAQLAQYLEYALFAQQNYDVCGYIFTIVENDFDESIKKYRTHSIFPVFTHNVDGKFTLEDGYYSPSPLREVSGYSRFLTYLRHHMKIKRLFNNKKRDIDIHASKQAISAFFTLLEQHFPQEKMSFIIDADRRSIYNVPSRNFSYVRKEFIRTARAYNHHVVNLQKYFSEAFSKEKKRFEFLDDYHWNSYAHNIASKAYLLEGGMEFIKSNSRCHSLNGIRKTSENVSAASSP